MPSAKDFVLAKLAVKDRLLTPQQLQECYQVQAQTHQPLGDVMVKRGLCDPARLLILDRACDEAMKSGRVMNCPKCSLKYFASQWSPSQVYPCPKCKTRMAPLQDMTASVQDGDERVISTLRVKIADERAQQQRGVAVQIVQKAKDSGKLTMRYRKPQVDARAVPAESGKTFGHYLLHERLGAGGSAVVFKATDTRTRNVVALKIIKAMDATKGDVQEYAKRFDREARRLRALSHPNIAKVFDHGKYGENLFVAMHFIEGTSLEQLIAAENSEETRTRFSTEWDRNENLVLLIRDVLIGLQNAHERGAIHQDIKPSNMFLDAAGRCYLTDFAIAREEDQEISETLAGGGDRDFSYFSPEQADRKGGAPDARSDVFSMGTVLYEVLTLRRPFAADSPAQTLQAIQKQHPKDPKELDRSTPDPLVQICLKALEKHPADRYPSAGAFADDLTRYIAGEPVEASRRGLTAKITRLVARNKMVKITLVACAAWLIASVIGAFMLPSLMRGVRVHAGEAKQKADEEAALARRKAAEPFLRNGNAALSRVFAAKDPEAFGTALRDARRGAMDALVLDPTSTDAHLIDGTVARLEGRFEDALRSLTLSVHHHPANGLAHLERGRCFLELHRHFPTEPRFARSGDLALRDFRQAASHATQSHDRDFALGLSAMLLGNESDALGAFNKALEAQSGASEVYLERARLKLQRLSLEEALRDFDLAVAFFPGCVFAHIGRGHVLLADGNLREALAAFERANGFAGGYPWAKLGMGVALMLQGDNDRALALFNEVLQSSSRMPEAYGNRGTVLARKGDLGRAIESYDHALEIHPEYWEALINRGYVHLLHGDKGKARNDMVQFQAKAPNHPFRYQVERWMRMLEGG